MRFSRTGGQPLRRARGLFVVSRRHRRYARVRSPAPWPLLIRWLRSMFRKPRRRRGSPTRATIHMRTPDVAPITVQQKPRDDEIDVYGLSHPGLVRAGTEDHFLLASIHKRVQVLQTNLAEIERLPLEDERLAFFAMVADGVGGADA